MKNNNNDYYSKGFSLLEIMLTLGIIAIIAALTIPIANSIKGMTQLSETKNRMQKIITKAKEYYRGQETLPTPTGINLDEVPTGISNFNLEEKYRFDAWGQPFFYRWDDNPSGYVPVGITELTVDGKAVAGLLISGGPNQKIDVDTSTTTFASTADDIVMAINVDQEAREIALQELKVLQSKVWAFDAVFEGVNNDGLTTNPDEQNCVKAEEPLPPPSCQYTDLTTGLSNDPNCGTATLDEIENDPDAYLCTVGALDKISEFYALADNYLHDPWGELYQWGQGLEPYATSPNPQGGPPFYLNNPRFHKVFSFGPDGGTSSATNPDQDGDGIDDDIDDIIP